MFANASLTEVATVATVGASIVVSAVSGVYTVWPFGERQKMSLKDNLEIWTLSREAGRSEHDLLRRAIDTGLDEVYCERPGPFTSPGLQRHALDWCTAVATFLVGAWLIAQGVGQDSGVQLVLGAMLWLIATIAARKAGEWGK